jgi:hypothetical protein
VEVAVPAWIQGLNACLQLIVIDRDDIEIEMGQVEHGDLKARAFQQLQKVLTNEQVLSLGWLALADVACWPQLEPTEAHALAHTIRLMTPQMPPRVATGRTPRDAGYRAASVILNFIAQAQRQLADTNAIAPDFEPVRVAINALAHLRKNRVAFWEQWLRRVIEASASLTPEEACNCAISALLHTVALPARFEYGSERSKVRGASDTDGPFEIFVATPRQDGRRIASLGRLSGLAPVKRKVSATFTPAAPTDRYRMGYYLRTVCMSELMDDATMGYYDTVTCTNENTGELWAFAAT